MTAVAQQLQHGIRRPDRTAAGRHRQPQMQADVEHHPCRPEQLREQVPQSRTRVADGLERTGGRRMQLP
jgi:hypothetical protein